MQYLCLCSVASALCVISKKGHGADGHFPMSPRSIARGVSPRTPARVRCASLLQICTEPVIQGAPQPYRWCRIRTTSSTPTRVPPPSRGCAGKIGLCHVPDVRATTLVCGAPTTPSPDVDTVGCTDQVFGLCYLLGFTFMPRPKNLASRHGYRKKGCSAATPTRNWMRCSARRSISIAWRNSGRAWCEWQQH